MAQPIESFAASYGRDSLSKKRYNSVRNDEIVYEDETDNAFITERRVTMHDKSVYKMSEIRPKQQLVETAYIQTPSWTLNHHKGVERYMALAVAELGMTSYSISPQQNLLRIGNMHRSSRDYIAMAKHRAIATDLDPHHYVVGGRSRGADYAIAMTAAAPHLDAEVDYFEATSPCLPLNVIRANLLKSLRNLADEPASAIGIVRDEPEYAKEVLLQTAALDRKEAFQQQKEIVTLADGSVGREAKRMPQDSFGFTQHFTRDGLGDVYNWQVLDEFENVTQRFSDGTHLHCVAPRTLREVVERLRDVRDGKMSGAVGAVALNTMVASDNPHFTSEPGPRLTIAS